MPKVVKKREEVSEVDQASVITLYKAGHSETKIVAQTEIAKPNVHCTGNLSLMIRNIHKICEEKKALCMKKTQLLFSNKPYLCQLFGLKGRGSLK